MEINSDDIYRMQIKVHKRADEMDDAGGGLLMLTGGEITTSHTCKLELGQFLIYIADGCSCINDAQFVVFNRFIPMEVFGYCSKNRIKELAQRVGVPDPRRNLTLSAFQHADATIEQELGEASHATDALVALYESVGQLMLESNQDPIAQNRYDRFMQQLKETAATGSVFDFSMSSFVKRMNNEFEINGDILEFYMGGGPQVSVPEGITTIGEDAFLDKFTIQSVILPDSVTCICECAFSQCLKLKLINLPEGLTEIGEYAFENCDGFTSIEIPSTVNTIGEGAFSGCLHLKWIRIPSTYTDPERTIFDGCDELETVIVYGGKKDNAVLERIKGYFEQDVRVIWEGDEQTGQKDEPVRRRSRRTKTATSVIGEEKQVSSGGKSDEMKNELETHVESFYDVISFDLPEGYETTWKEKDDGSKQCIIHYGEHIDDDGETAYEFTAKVSGIDIKSTNEDPIPAGERLFDTIHRRDPQLRCISFSSDPEAEIHMKETPVNFLGRQFKYYALNLVIQISVNQVASVMMVSQWDEDNADKNVALYEHMIKVVNAVQYKGKLLPARKLTAAELIEQLKPDFEGVSSITPKIGVEFRVNDEVVSTSSLFGDDEGNVHVEDVDDDSDVLDGEYPVAYPADELYSHYGRLMQEENKFRGMGVHYVSENGEEFQAIKIRRLLYQKGLNKTKLYRKLKAAESVDSYTLDELALKMAQVFRVNESVFVSRHDDEGDIHECLMDKIWKLSALRSFAWTLAEMADREGKSIDDYDYPELVDLCNFIEGCEWLNYEGDSWFDSLCGYPDTHVFYMPGEMVESGEAEEVCDVLAVYPVASLDALRGDLMQLRNAMIKLHNGILITRDRNEKLDTPAAAVLQAWLVMVMSARTAFFSEDGPMFFYHSYPSDPLNTRALPVGTEKASVVKKQTRSKKPETTSPMESAAKYEIVQCADGRERIKLGEYPAGSPITWLVLEKSDEELLLLSEFALDAKPFFDFSYGTQRTNEWQDSTLRAWLNKEFYMEAFNDTERGLILEETNVTYRMTADGEVEKTPSTTDKVSLLGMGEVKKYFPRERDRICKATRYARENGAEIENGPDQCEWWLRSPAVVMMGVSNSYAPSISPNGSFRGWGIYSKETCIRPVIRIKRINGNPTPEGQMQKERKTSWTGDNNPEREEEQANRESEESAGGGRLRRRQARSGREDAERKVTEESVPKEEECEGNGQPRRRQARAEREDADCRAADEERKEKQRNQLKAKIQKLKDERDSLKGLFTGTKRSKLQKQIDEMTEQLRAI